MVGGFHGRARVNEVTLGRWAKVRSVLLHEFREVLPPTLFFFVGFNLILFTKRLILADYLIQFTGFFIATIGALVVGKVVLVVDKLPFLRRFDLRPWCNPSCSKRSSIRSSSSWHVSSRRLSIT